MLDKTSEQRLQGVAPMVENMVRAAAEQLASIDIWICVVSGLRSASEQNKLYNQGRTAPGKIVTNAMAGQSMHNYGLAVDIVPYVYGQTGRLNWKADTPQFQHMVAQMKRQDFEWGGDWLGSLGDFDHFQVPKLRPTPTPTMRFDYARYGDGNLEPIWKKVAAGEYA